MHHEISLKVNDNSVLETLYSDMALHKTKVS